MPQSKLLEKMVSRTYLKYSEEAVVDYYNVLCIIRPVRLIAHKSIQDCL
jgi:hypothetical protein